MPRARHVWTVIRTKTKRAVTCSAQNVKCVLPESRRTQRASSQQTQNARHVLRVRTTKLMRGLACARPAMSANKARGRPQPAPPRQIPLAQPALISSRSRQSLVRGSAKIAKSAGRERRPTLNARRLQTAPAKRAKTVLPSRVRRKPTSLVRSAPGAARERNESRLVVQPRTRFASRAMQA